MTIRLKLFLLFLYLLLVWIGSAYVYLLGQNASPPDFLRSGVFWTIAGVAALALWVILEHVFGWWRMRQARRSVTPMAAAAPAPAAKPTHPDDLAVAQLIEEANQKLAQAEAYRGSSTTIFDLPMILIIGNEGSGKTSVLQNSGLEAHLLAGQATGGGGATMPTRSANIWLARNMIYLEIGGRVLGSDAGRFAEWLSVLRSAVKKQGVEKWMAGTAWARMMVAEPARPSNLKGVLLAVDLKDFLGTPEMSKLDRAASAIREKLDAIGAHFGTACPVYVLFSRTDQVQYFKEFFARLGENDATQLFGVMTPSEGKAAGGDQVWAEAETRRLNRFFNQLFLRLSDRRLQALTTEPQMAVRPAIYEFPREFKRVRTPLVQYLVDVFRPNPLKQAPALRGFFFSGTRMVERSQAVRGNETAVFQAGATQIFSGGATQIFQGGATQIFSPSQLAGAEHREAGPRVQSWMFLPDLFHKVLEQDKPAVAPVVAARRTVPAPLKLALGGLAMVGALLAIVWTVSWWENREELSAVTAAADRVKTVRPVFNLADLRAEDQLRQSLEAVETGDSLRRHWGLYTGDDAMRAGRQVYFQRLREMMLDSANAVLVADMQKGGDPAADTSQLYSALKTHLTITAKACPVDEPMVQDTLGRAVAAAQPTADGEAILLTRRQLAYYTRVLKAEENVPVRLIQIPEAVAKARTDLANSNGLEPKLQGLLAQVGKAVPGLKTSAIAPGFEKVLEGPAGLGGEYTAAGEQMMVQLIHDGKFGSGGADECVLGVGQSLASAGGLLNDSAKKDLAGIYHQRYAEAWRTYLKGFRVVAYHGPADAAAKLALLSGSQSPLIRIFKTAARNTYFPEKPEEPSRIEQMASKVSVLAGMLSAAKDKEKKAQAAAAAILPAAKGIAASDISRVMQPVHATTPPLGDEQVTEAGKAYVDGLFGLQQGLETLLRTAGADRAATIPAVQQALAMARAAHRALTGKFSDAGSLGFNADMADLLEQPIRLADKEIPRNQETFSAGKINADLAKMCLGIRPMLTRYPFNPKADDDATLADVARAFAPMSGLVWQFQQTSLGESVLKQGKAWIAGPKKPAVTPSMVDFLSRAELLADALYPDGNATAPPKLVYSLIRVEGQRGIELRIDGATPMNTVKSALRGTFTWPVAPGQSSAEGVLVTSQGETAGGFGLYTGQWAVFRLMQSADPRELNEPTVKWSGSRGQGKGAGIQALNPPAVVKFASFPNGVDLFNPKFFDALRCPSSAVAAE